MFWVEMAQKLDFFLGVTKLLVYLHYVIVWARSHLKNQALAFLLFSQVEYLFVCAIVLTAC